ncbi:MAG: LysM peptidoglycan-binding domain-containing protein [Planctomycetaceae bacterium]
MSHRSRGGRRRGRSSDPLDTVKPLVVLGLLGMIVYGAVSMVRSSGPANDPLAGGAAPPGLAPAAVELPTESAPAPIFASAPPAPPAPAPGAAPPADVAATYLPAQAAPAPVAEPARSFPLPAAPPVPVAPPVATADAATVVPATRQAAPSPPGSAAFTAAWADAHDKLSAGRYAEALSVLSVWYDDPSLGPEESQRLDELLGQLAGTVIYSQRDLLMAPHVVTPGQTLPAIAAPLQVPWQLLARINGIPDPNQLVPGEHIKLVRGPFDAVISVSRRRLSLQVAGHYAGSYPVALGRGLTERIGSSVAVVDVRSAAATGDAPRRSLVLADGLALEAVDDPAAVADAALGATVLVATRDFVEMIDILGPGSHVLVRR